MWVDGVLVHDSTGKGVLGLGQMLGHETIKKEPYLNVRI